MTSLEVTSVLNWGAVKMEIVGNDGFGCEI